MFGYIALVWNALSCTDSEIARSLIRRFDARSPRWRTVLDIPGFALISEMEDSRADEIYLLHNQQGAILGKLFTRDYEAEQIPGKVIFNEKISDNIISGEGKYLNERYWGRYVAFLHHELSGKTWVMRDPTGAIPCSMVRIQTINVYFHRLEDCENLASLSLSVNREYIIGRLILAAPANRLTGLTEVTMVCPGECVEHWREERRSWFFWNPLEVASRDPFEDPREAEQLLRRTVRACIHAWASCHDKILHCLSGGLDSSIVLACLKDAPTRPTIICENLYGREDSEEDERQYARLMAQHVGCELLETESTDSYHFHVPQGLPHTLDPVYLWDMERIRANKIRAASNNTFGAMLNGDGGDELFFTRGWLPTAADYVYCHGISSSLRIIMDDMLVDETSLLQVLSKAIRYGSLKHPWNYRDQLIERVKRRRVVDELIPMSIREEAYRSDFLIHPLYTHASGSLPPGKIFHAALVSLGTDIRYTPWPMDLPPRPIEVAPLMSQPVLELCLRIPLYVLRIGGRDRSLARRAFSRDLPTKIMERRSKGIGNNTCQMGLRQHIDLVRKTLLDGLLVENGYLNRRKLSEGLHLTAPTRMKIPAMTVWRYFVLEIWYRRWSAAAHRIAA